MPPLIFLTSAFCTGVLLTFTLPEHSSGYVWTCLAATALAAAACFIARKQAFFQAALWLLVLFLGTGYGITRVSHALSKQWQAELHPQSIDLTLNVIGLPEHGDKGQLRFIGDVRTTTGERYRILFQDYSGQMRHTGENWQVRAKIRAAVGSRNPAGFDREAWALANGIDGIASINRAGNRLPESPWWHHPFDRVRARISQRWQATAERYPNGSGLMQALAVGNRSGLSRDTWAAMRPLGINHLVSISGLHIGMTALLAAWLMKRLLTAYAFAVTRLKKTFRQPEKGLRCIRLLHELPEIPPRPRLWYLSAGAVCAALYSGLAGFEIPTVRSLLMLTVFAYGWYQRGNVSAWQTWWLALAAVLLYQPAAALAAGFWLSFGIVAALLWIFAWRTPARRNTCLEFFRQALRGQWAAFVLGSIATAVLFGLIPVFSPLANAAAIPFFSWLLVPVALLTSLLPFDALYLGAAWLGEHTVSALHYWGNLLPEHPMPQTPLPMLIAVVAAALLLLLPRGLQLKPLCCCILAAWLLYRPASVAEPLKATVWDVGQGLSVLLQTPRYNLLFDTGTAAAETGLLPNLRAIGVRRLDDLILSHHDNDHDGGFSALQKSIPIRRIWSGQPEFHPQSQHCREGIRWTADNVIFELLTPSPNADSDNEKSCVLRIVSGSQAILITGDLGMAGEAKLIERHGGALFSQILILGHHGSRYSNHSRFIHTVDPQLAIASSGFANPFKHPHPHVQNILNAHRVQLMRTDTQGALIIRFNHDSFQAAPAVSRKRWWQKKPFPLLPEN